MSKYFISILFVILVSCNSKPKEILREDEFYLCSMDPQVMEKLPGLCPICKMPLAKTTIDNSKWNLIKLSKDQIKLGNITTDTVRMGTVFDEKTLTGIVAVNENLVQEISSRFAGRIEKLYYKIPGQEVKVGDLIYEIYSRDLMLAEEEYIAAGNNALKMSSKNRLLLWGLTEDQIGNLAKGNEAEIVTPIYSKVSGTITDIPNKEGDYVDEGSVIFKLADLHSLWVEAQIYASDMNGLSEGDHVIVTTEAFPEEVIDGTVDFMNPEFQSESKISLIRVNIPNPQRKFVPGMMASVVLKSKSHSAVTLPAEAVLQNGKFSHIWMRNPDGSFEARKVEIGIQTQTQVEITSGIRLGEVVVVSGAYLIYSDYVFKRGEYPLNDEEKAGRPKMKKMEGM
ncbi:MAG: efflux RND transporter periplasmic adaptor subunit [Bacteroidetes bacterium]|nr:efflux RND transporter periplasmic adaptor subunit [Bacteroidota bacterium]